MPLVPTGLFAAGETLCCECAPEKFTAVHTHDAILCECRLWFGLVCFFNCVLKKKKNTLALRTGRPREGSDDTHETVCQLITDLLIHVYNIDISNIALLV